MTRRPKGASMKGKGNPVRETPLHVEPDEHGNRRERRLWKRRYGRQARPVSEATEEPSGD